MYWIRLDPILSPEILANPDLLNSPDNLDPLNLKGSKGSFKDTLGFPEVVDSLNPSIFSLNP